MKSVIIVGANGRCARLATPLLLSQSDVALSLFARRRDQLEDIATPDTSVIEGDARDRDVLTPAMAGQDIVIVALGGGDLDETTAAVVDAAVTAGVTRIIAINAGGIYDELPEPFNSWDRKQVGQYRAIMRRAADAIEESPLSYTILRPVWLTDKHDTELDLTQKGETFRGTETSRASVAQLIASIVETPEIHVNENLGISQPNTSGDRPAAYR